MPDGQHHRRHQRRPAPAARPPTRAGRGDPGGGPFGRGEVRHGNPRYPAGRYRAEAAPPAAPAGHDGRCPHRPPPSAPAAGRRAGCWHCAAGCARSSRRGRPRPEPRRRPAGDQPRPATAEPMTPTSWARSRSRRCRRSGGKSSRGRSASRGATSPRPSRCTPTAPPDRRRACAAAPRWRTRRSTARRPTPSPGTPTACCPTWSSASARPGSRWCWPTRSATRCRAGSAWTSAGAQPRAVPDDPAGGDGRLLRGRGRGAAARAAGPGAAHGPVERDDAMLALVGFRDPLGVTPNDASAHGNAFDRVSAFQDGFTDGAQRCAEMSLDNRVFTQRRFGSAEDLARGGDLPLPSCSPRSRPTPGGSATSPPWCPAACPGADRRTPAPRRPRPGPGPVLRGRRHGLGRTRRSWRCSTTSSATTPRPPWWPAATRWRRSRAGSPPPDPRPARRPCA